MTARAAGSATARVVLSIGVVGTLLAMTPSSAGSPALDMTSEVGPPEVDLSLDRAAFSPNDDGRSDEVVATVTTDTAGSLTLEVRDERGATVRTLLQDQPVLPGTTSVGWPGRDDSDGLVPDGTYTLVATLAVDPETTASSEASVVVDTVPPGVRWRSIRPQPVMRPAARVTFSFRLLEAERGRVLVTDLLGAVVHRDRWVGRGGLVERRWDMRTYGGARVPPGQYEVTVTARDEAGNVAAGTPRILRDLHPVVARVVRSVRGAGRLVALTFDDCWDKGAWARILTALSVADAKGTFFCPGRRVLASPTLARRTVREGHGIGAHGWDHADLTRLGFAQITDRLRRDEGAWWRTTGTMAVPYFRPPYGALDADVRRAAGSTGYAWIAMWDVDPRDWAGPGVGAIVSKVVSGAHAGSIVVLHVKQQTALALPAILRGLRARGLRPVTLPELLSRASAIEPGRAGRPSA